MEDQSKKFINLGLVLNDQGKMLAVRRAKEEHYKDGSILRWALPGGKQKFGESRKECVEREVLDETGYKVAWIKEISLRFHPQAPAIIVYHRCKLVQPEPLHPPNQPEEIAEVRWVLPEEWKNLATTSIDPQVAKELKIA